MLSGILYTFSFYFPADVVVCVADPSALQIRKRRRNQQGNVLHLIQI
jgi:hypothetical protein